MNLKKFLLNIPNKIFGLFGLELVYKIPSMPIYAVDRIIDVGVASGTEPLLKNYRNCYFILIEPHPFYHDFIQKNILNHVKGYLLKYGVGNKNEDLELLDNGRASGFFSREDNLKRNKVKVKVKKLDNLLDEIKFFETSDATLLKIDTEGFELNVLKGATKLLSSKMLKYVILELRISFIKNNYNPTDIFVFLNEYGFKFLRIDKVAYRKKGVSYLDITFSKK